MGSRSDTKGKNYERYVAGMLAEWVGLDLIRTPMSGAWSGTAGDITLRGPGEFPLTVECKKDESWDLYQLLVGTGPFDSWVDQLLRETAEDSALAGRVKHPVLLFTKNYKPDYVAVPYSPLLSSRLSRYIQVTHSGRPWIVVDFLHFKQTISYQDYLSDIRQCSSDCVVSGVPGHRG